MSVVAPIASTSKTYRDASRSSQPTVQFVATGSEFLAPSDTPATTSHIPQPNQLHIAAPFQSTQDASSKQEQLYAALKSEDAAKVHAALIELRGMLNRTKTNPRIALRTKEPKLDALIRQHCASDSLAVQREAILFVYARQTYRDGSMRDQLSPPRPLPDEYDALLSTLVYESVLLCRPQPQREQMNAFDLQCALRQLQKSKRDAQSINDEELSDWVASIHGTIASFALELTPVNPREQATLAYVLSHGDSWAVDVAAQRTIEWISERRVMQCEIYVPDFIHACMDILRNRNIARPVREDIWTVMDRIKATHPGSIPVTPQDLAELTPYR